MGFMRFDPNSDRQAVLQGPSHELLDTQLAAFKAFYLSTTSQDSEALEVTEAVEDNALDFALQVDVTMAAQWRVSCDVNSVAPRWDAVRDDYEIPVASRDI
jgi:hypothetical protein